VATPLFFATVWVANTPALFCFLSCQIISKLREGGANQQSAGKKVIQVKGANNNITHSMNDDERSEFTAHINSVLAGDLHIGDRIPIPTHTMQIFDECRGKGDSSIFSAGRHQEKKRNYVKDKPFSRLEQTAVLQTKGILVVTPIVHLRIVSKRIRSGSIFVGNRWSLAVQTDQRLSTRHYR